MPVAKDRREVEENPRRSVFREASSRSAGQAEDVQSQALEKAVTFILQSLKKAQKLVLSCLGATGGQAFVLSPADKVYFKQMLQLLQQRDENQGDVTVMSLVIALMEDLHATPLGPKLDWKTRKK